jgi:putative aldouronate transport system permease protein
MICFSAFCIVPLLLILSVSFSDETEILNSGYRLIPLKFSLNAYEYIFKLPEAIINAYGISIFVTAAGTIGGLLITSMLAYTISRKDYKYRNATSFMIFFTMLFNGGLVPWYILISRVLNMSDKIYVLFVPYLVVPWYVFLMKGFFSDIGDSIVESAKIDGSSEFRTFFSIIVPISKPGLATVGLFFALMLWNDWWLPMLFINNNKLVTLQYMLYTIMSNIEFISMQAGNTASVGIKFSKVPDLSARMATCILAIGPMLFAFPFFQKYLVKGIMVGSVKG